ncbi:MAG: outer membrane protein assembly factor BamB family protein [Acidobacteriota bacterium]
MRCREVIRRGPAFTWALVLVFGAILPAAEQWPQFRGANAGVVADDPALPDTWSETENVSWKTPIPGLAWSSPVVWNDHVFLTTAVSARDEAAPIKGLYDPGDDQGSVKSTAVHRWTVLDVDIKTGAIRWERELHRGVPPISRHIKNSFASETPVTDGERVYVYFGTLGLVAALDLQGTLLWKKEIGAFEGHLGFGAAASPILHKGRLYVVNDNTVRSFLVAFDAASGKELWRVGREERGNWSTPFVWENPQRTELVTAGTGRVRSYDLDGRLLWELAGMTTLTVPTPFAAHGLLYVSSGYPGQGLRPLYAIRPGASGDISLWTGTTNFGRFPGERGSSPFIAWAYPLLGTYNTSALVYGDYFYTLLDRGFLICHDAHTGAEAYGRTRVSAESSGFTASPWAYNGKVFLLSEDGDTFVVKAGPHYELLGRNALNEMTLATPAIAGGSVFIRTQSHLYRIAKRAP